LDHQNNFVEILKIISNAAKNFDILATSLILHNYFNNSKYFSDSAKISDLSAKPFFPMHISICGFSETNEISKTLRIVQRRMLRSHREKIFLVGFGM